MKTEKNTRIDFPKTAALILDELCRMGEVDESQMKVALLKCSKWQALGMPPHEIVSKCELSHKITEKAIDQNYMMNWLSRRTGIDIAEIDPLKIKVEEVTSVMSLAFAKRNGIIAIDVNKFGIVIAMSWPNESAWKASLEQVVNKPIRLVLATPEQIRRYQQEFYNLSFSVKGAKQEHLQRSDVHNFEQLIELGGRGDVDANDKHVVRIVDWLLQYAFEQRASDIHIEPRRDFGYVRFRIDGMLHPVQEFSAAVTSAVIARLKILGRMDVAEKRKPLDGRIKTKIQEGKEVELRLSTLPTAFGEKMVARIFDPDVVLMGFSQLGLTQKDEATWNQFIRQPNGIVLVTGPTGSGKTTTLYTTLKLLANSSVNVCTIEDPIEMVEGAFNQVQVQKETGVEFASGVRALLRQDPDIIMIGEIRDKETADMAIQAALTGHLVLSTLHTNEAPTAVSRLLELGVQAFLINATLNGVMAQRLVRTLCPHCKQKVPANPNECDIFKFHLNIDLPQELYEPVGCKICRQTGFLGRAGIYEIMPFGKELSKAVSQNQPLEELKRIAQAQDMTTLTMAGLHKVLQGETNLQELMRVVGIITTDLDEISE